MCRYQGESQECARVLTSGCPLRALITITARTPAIRTAANRARAGSAPSGIPRRAVQGMSGGPTGRDGAAGSGRGTDEVLTLLTLGTPDTAGKARLGFLTHFHPDSGIAAGMGANSSLPPPARARACPELPVVRAERRG